MGVDMLYECDPEKNKPCDKQMCALVDYSEYKECRLTACEEYAKDGGKRYVLINGKMFEMDAHRELPTR